MNEDSLIIVNKMIDYFYRGDYHAAEATQVDEQGGVDVSALQLHARIFALADKYAVDSLMHLSAAKYSNRLKHSTILDFLQSIPDVYALTPAAVRALRNEAVQHARMNLARSLVDPSVKRAYEDVASITPDFVKELLDSYMDAPVIGKCWACGPCQALEAVQSRCLQCGEQTDLPCC